jgi:transketolase
MRNAFIQGLSKLAENDKNIMLLTGDLGYGIFEDFEKKFPNQFLNCGVAEQNMIGVAAGLASEGKRVFVYSIANFPTFRCLEQIRNDICYHGLPVTIVSIGSGFSYGTLGYSHYAIEDIAIMRCLPGLRIFSPVDPNSVIDSLNLTLQEFAPS